MVAGQVALVGLLLSIGKAPSTITKQLTISMATEESFITASTTVARPWGP